MINHLTRTELLDAIEAPSQISTGRTRHLEECNACRLQVDSLRGVLARARADRVPEPSPLFWDHFSARVSEAVRDQSIGADQTAWWPRVRRPLATWAAASLASVLVLVTVLWRATVHAPSFPRVAPPDAVVTLEAPPADNLDADERWAVVRAAAENVAWEDVHDAGITAAPGETEGVALELTADERSELARLINQELKRNGV
jgi:hypothetical protein